eukprot:69730-Ditylum_brightwellii.AAC.1
MEISTPENSSQPDTDYEHQFVWDDDAQEPTNNAMDDTVMEQAKEVGEKRKAKEPDTPLSKSSKKGVILGVVHANVRKFT